MGVNHYPENWLERHLSIETGAASDQSARTPFDRDHDRLLYSSAFRALGQKTQVVAGSANSVSSTTDSPTR